MTDLEITRACAVAMGIELEADHAYFDSEGSLRSYCPLHDDAQAMALVKKFKINIVWYEVNVPSGFQPCVYMWGRNDLNRAICECVAKMSKP